jgi:hypothetical protein
MEDYNNSLKQLNEIKSMMERSSRFISLSGWSGISAGISALIGAFIANRRIDLYAKNEYSTPLTSTSDLVSYLMIVGLLVLLSAMVTAFLFTYLKSKKANTPIWGSSAKRLMWHTLLPILVGGVFILQLIDQNQFQLVASGCLIFYGLGLVNGSKFTLGEVRYLGYIEIILGLVSLFFTHHGLLFWALGFGVFHIIYGMAMWWKYDRVENEMK